MKEGAGIISLSLVSPILLSPPAYPFLSLSLPFPYSLPYYLPHLNSTLVPNLTRTQHDHQNITKRQEPLPSIPALLSFSTSYQLSPSKHLEPKITIPFPFTYHSSPPIPLLPPLSTPHPSRPIPSNPTIHKPSLPSPNLISTSYTVT